MNFEHKPVLYHECIENLNINPQGIYVDATVGGAGHSSGILSNLKDNGQLLGIDQDINAINAAGERLSKINTKANFKLIHSNFENIRQVLGTLKIKAINGALIDLGVSSHQLDEAKRGFSYKNEGPLDMRMDIEQEINAKDIVNKYTKEKLTKIIRDYGEEKWAARIAEFIVMNRQEQDITTTTQLTEIIKNAIPAKARRTGPHPAKRTFQAIRIEVNRELEIIEQVIKDFVSVLAPKGRLLIITFHSLEDRIVKKTFKELERPCTCPPSFPICVCGKEPKIKVITSKPIKSKETELDDNPRARSAKLRVAEKI